MGIVTSDQIKAKMELLLISSGVPLSKVSSYLEGLAVGNAMATPSGPE